MSEPQKNPAECLSVIDIFKGTPFLYDGVFKNDLLQERGERKLTSLADLETKTHRVDYCEMKIKRELNPDSLFYGRNKVIRSAVVSMRTEARSEASALCNH